jgi:mono/diheme cytochrome c family protein
LILRLLVAALLLIPLARPADAASGQDQFKRLCSGCHKADGTGVPGFGPPLKEGLKPILAAPRGTEYVVHIVIGGLTGSIVSMGKRFNGVMPSFAGQSDETLLAVLEHVVGTLNGAAPPDAAMLVAARTAKPRPKANHELRQELLGPGA